MKTGDPSDGFAFFGSRRSDGALRGMARIGLGLLALAVLALVCGAAYEALARRQHASRFTLQGTLVDVGQRALHLDCRGAGSPTVVFESGLGSFGALDWELVQDEVAKTTRACSYSRAGILASDPAEGARDANAVAADLHRLLTLAGERPPLVLVAHSLGGLFALRYTGTFGSEVAGLVLVDTLHPDSIRSMEAAGLHVPLPLRELQIADALAWTGWVRLGLGGDTEAAYEVASLRGMRGELEAIDQSAAQAGSLRALGGRPVYVLSSGKVEEDFLVHTSFTAEQGQQFLAIKQRLNEDQASWSSQSRHEVVADAMHAIQWQRPDRVVNAARWVIDAVRAGAER